MVGALLTSTKGIIAKLLYRDGVGFESILLVRAWMSLPLVWGWALYRVGLTSLLSGERRLIAGAMLAGLTSYYAGAWLDFAALTMIDASLERVLLFSYPVMVVAARAVGQRQWPPAKVVAGVMATYVGVACAVGGFDRQLWNANALGATLVMASAAGFAYYLIANERVATVLGSVPFIVYATTAATGALTLHCLIFDTGAISHLSPHAWSLIGGMTVATNVLPLFLFSAGIRRIGAQRASIVSTIGPPATLVMAWLLLDEVMHPIQIAGAALILSGIVILERGRPA